MRLGLLKRGGGQRQSGKESLQFLSCLSTLERGEGVDEKKEVFCLIMIGKKRKNFRSCSRAGSNRRENLRLLREERGRGQIIETPSSVGCGSPGGFKRVREGGGSGRERKGTCQEPAPSRPVVESSGLLQRGNCCVEFCQGEGKHRTFGRHQKKVISLHLSG